MFYLNVNNSRSFIFYFIIIFVNVICPLPVILETRRLSQGEVGMHPCALP